MLREETLKPCTLTYCCQLYHNKLPSTLFSQQLYLDEMTGCNLYRNNYSTDCPLDSSMLPLDITCFSNKKYIGN